MLTFSETAMQAFKAAAMRRFEDDMVEHMRAHFPNHLGVAGADGARALARLAVERASAYGIESERGVCLYFNAMMLLGSYLDVDPQVPWAGEVLMQGYAEPDARAESLADRAVAWFSRIAGPQNRALNRTLVQVYEGSAAMFRHPPQGALPDHLTRVLGWISPAKCELLGTATQATLIEESLARTRGLGLVTPFGQICYVAFCFMLGSGFVDDPMHGWAREALGSGLSGDALAERLHGAAMARLGEFLARA